MQLQRGVDREGFGLHGVVLMSIDRRPKKGVLSTPIAPASGAPWRGRVRPCEWCRGRIITATAAMMDIQHEASCKALKG